ncbi:hypothetical protein EWM64_g5351 [Hericium alpestre]|uniref:F-box domain-containing protein n=1 Tax=Hericium alpestre TaxID=135208 RepID=A0A4Y9ZXL9_9AGAM|nr:hypothetical protein EWM64_g5351 [Hericium alpestre]
MIRQLNYMPYLRSLRADFYARDIEISDTVKKMNFASLQEIELTQGELVTFTSFLDMLLDGLNIEKINMEHMECEPSLAINRLVGAVCRVCSPEALKSFNLGTDGLSKYEHSPDFITNNATLSPLFKFRHMEFFSVSLGDPDWDDRLLGDIANAWPNLRRLALRKHGRKPSKLTFRGLASLAKGCPRLEDLFLSLAPWNADIDRTILRSWNGPTRSSPLHMVLRYPLMNLETQAESHLRHVFPNLSQLDVKHVDDH